MSLLKTLCRNVKIECTYGAKLDWNKQESWQQASHGYSVTLTYQRRRLTVDFWMGSAHTSEPNAADVLECLLSDARSGVETFEEWCSELGMNQDSRQAERVHKACVAMHKKLQRFLAADFDRFMLAEA